MLQQEDLDIPIDGPAHALFTHSEHLVFHVGAAIDNAGGSADRGSFTRWLACIPPVVENALLRIGSMWARTQEVKTIGPQ